MKKIILFLSLILSYQITYCQSFLPEVVPYTATGFTKLIDENPFVLSQSAGSNNTWTNLASYTWIPASVPGYNKERKVSQFSANTWILNQLEQNEIVVDNQNRMTSVIQDQTYNYSGSPYRSKIKYLFTYNAQNKVSRVLMQIAEGPSYINFVDYYNLSYTYNVQGNLISDSMYVYGNLQSYKRDYTYDANGKPVNQTYFEYSSDDTTSRTTYTYVNDRLHASYTISLNQTSDIWETTSADTFDYDQSGNIIRRISYGAAFMDGQFIPFSPLTNETYTYNSSNKLDQMERRSWNADLLAWVNAARYTFNYNNNIPALGYMYNWNATSQTYETDPAVRFLFALPTALNEDHITSVSDIEVYPNPAKNKVSVSYARVQGFQQSAISLYNMSGQLFSVPVKAENGLAELDISNLSTGIYYLHIQSGETVIKKKLVVQ